MGNEEDYQREMGKFEEVIRQKGVGEIRRSQRIMSGSTIHHYCSVEQQY